MAQPDKLLGKLLMLFVATLSSGTAAELWLRLLAPAPWRYQPPPEAILMVERPQLGYAPRPGASAHWKREGRRINVDISSEGLRDDPLDQARAASFRVIAVGDSFTFGIGVQRDEAWPELLERQIEARLGHSASVVNAGVPAYSVRQMRLRASELLPQVAPALVVAGLYARSYWRIGEPYRVYGGVLVMSDAVPRLAIAESGDLIFTPFHDGPVRDADVWLKDHFQLGARIFAVVGPKVWRESTIPVEERDRSAWTDRDYQPVFDEITQLQALLAERDIPLVVLLVNHQETDGSFSPDEARYNAHVAQFCSERDLPLANPLPRFVAEGRGEAIFRTPSDIHWTPLAQEIAAQEVMKVLEARGLLKRHAHAAT